MLPDVELTVTPPVRLYQETKDFLRFLRTAAQKHSVTVSYSSSDTGTFGVSTWKGLLEP